MKYRALVFDLDGTAIPNQLDGMPSEKVVKSVVAAREVAKVSIATGRPFSMCSQIVKALKIVSLCVVSGGTQIVDPISGKPVWEQFLTIDQSTKLIEIARKYKLKACFDGASEKEPLSTIQITGEEKIFAIFATQLDDVAKIEKALLEIKGIAFASVVSWESGVDIHVTHQFGTKKHALEKLLEIEKIDRSTLMVVGDGNNDLPLFANAGFKVAMGNAGEQLKAAADVVAPSVNDDGLAWAIEKYILES